MVSISFGIALVAGRTRVPRPATGKTALRIFMGVSGALRTREEKCVDRMLVAGLQPGTKADVWMPAVAPSLPCGSNGGNNKICAFVKLLETVTGPSETGFLRADGYDMRWTEAAMNKRAGAIVVAAALLFAGPARRSRPAAATAFRTSSATSSPGQKSARRRRRPRPARDGAPPPWSGEDGASGHPLMTAAAIREAAANFRQLRRRDVARCRTPQHHAGEFRALHRGARARPAASWT